MELWDIEVAGSKAGFSPYLASINLSNYFFLLCALRILCG